jgi:hypothetical protein
MTTSAWFAACQTTSPPRPVFPALEHVNAVFSDCKLDKSINIDASDIPGLRRQGTAPFLKYGFRNKNGKAVIGYWIAAHSVPSGVFAPLSVDLTLKNSGIRNPVLIDIVSGEISPLEWKAGTTDTLERLPVRDSVLAIADAGYFDWPVLPEAPSGLSATARGSSFALKWELHGNDVQQVAVERRTGDGAWKKIATEKAETTFIDSNVPAGSNLSYRVRAGNAAGISAYSNVARPVRWSILSSGGNVQQHLISRCKGRSPRLQAIKGNAF